MVFCRTLSVTVTVEGIGQCDAMFPNHLLAPLVQRLSPMCRQCLLLYSIIPPLWLRPTEDRATGPGISTLNMVLGGFNDGMGAGTS
jgi:hypothetical protein